MAEADEQTSGETVMDHKMDDPYSDDDMAEWRRWAAVQAASPPLPQEGQEINRFIATIGARDAALAEMTSLLAASEAMRAERDARIAELERVLERKSTTIMELKDEVALLRNHPRVVSFTSRPACNTDPADDSD